MRLLFTTLGFCLCANCSSTAESQISAGEYPSLAEAVAKNSGHRIYIPDGRFEIDEPLVIRTDGTKLVGPGVIVQRNTNAAVIEIRGARNILLRDLTLTRPTGKQDTSANAIWVRDSEDVRLEDLQIKENRTDTAAVRIMTCRNVSMERCVVLNYKRLAIDDRMATGLYQFAFRCINGTGIFVIDSVGTRLAGNRVIEHNLLPTREIQEKYDLGLITARSEKRARLGPEPEETHQNRWHQGSGIWVLGSAGANRHTLIQDNFIENPAQGIDVACDFVTVTGNHVTKSYMGMKAMHGSRGILIANNIFHAPDKYGILLRPGFNASSGSSAESGKAAAAPNVQGGIVVANNIITDIGYGNEGWRLWKPGAADSKPVGLLLGSGPLPENPAMHDVLITGNLIYDSGADKVVQNGKLETEGPRYKYAVWIDQNPPPRSLHFQGNVFHPGEHGISNVELRPSLAATDSNR